MEELNPTERYMAELLDKRNTEIKKLKGLIAGALYAMRKEAWEKGPTLEEVSDALWTVLDNADDDFPLVKQSNQNKLDEYLIQKFEEAWNVTR